VWIFYDVTQTTVDVLAIVTKSKGQVMARIVRKSGVKEVPLSELKLENDPRFLRRIEQARNSLQAGRGVRLEDIETD
jgi:hypothetical protein